MSKQTEALKLALESLEEGNKLCLAIGGETSAVFDPAITAIREALDEQPAKQPKLSDYEPDGMHHNKPHKCKYPKCSYPCLDLPDCRDAEQPAQVDPCVDGSCSCCWTHLDEQPAQQQYQSTADKCELTPALAKGTLLPAQQQPDEVTIWKARAMQAEAVIEKFMEQPAPVAEPHKQQEPVAHCRVRPLRGDQSFATVEVDWVSSPVPGPLYTSPSASKPWVGLTVDEINEVLGGDIRDEPSGALEFVRAIEAKLREKNA